MSEELKKEAREEFEKLAIVRDGNNHEHQFNTWELADYVIKALTEKYIDKATLAERKRCAEIIRDKFDKWHDAKSRGLGVTHDEARKAIAKAIENHGKE